MQLIDGTDVAKLASCGPLPVPEVGRIFSAVADALDFAGHAAWCTEPSRGASIGTDQAARCLRNASTSAANSPYRLLGKPPTCGDVVPPVRLELTLDGF